MKWTRSLFGGRGLDLAGTALGAASAMVAVALLASMGIDASDPEGPGSRSMLLKGLGAVLALATTFGLTAKLLRREEEREARGRVVVDDGREAGARSAVGLALGCLALGLVLMAALEVGVSALTPDREEPDAARGKTALEEARISRSQTQAAPSGGSGTGGGSAAAGLIGPGQHSGSSQGANGVRLGDLLSDEPILRVTSITPLPMATTHLRGLVLDQYGSSGTLRERRSARPEVFEADANGWIEVPAGESLAPTTAPGLRTQLKVEVLAPSNGVIFAPTPLRAIETARATFDAAAALWTAAPDDQGRQAELYGVRSESPALSVAELERQPARGSYSGSNLLPSASSGSERAYALSSLKAYADTIAAGSASDLEEVIAVVSHLRGAFGYELYDAGMLSPERCVDLIERGSGSCTHFASLAVLLLRSRDIPARVAVGYVAREELLPEEGPGWLVRSRDGHAWIEVHFEGYGWLPFDPTPGDSTAGGASTGWTPLAESEPSVSRWLDSLSPRSASLARGARTSALGEWVASALASTFGAMRDLALDLGRSVLGQNPGSATARAPWIVGILGLVALAAWGWRRRLRRAEAIELATDHAGPWDHGRRGDSSANAAPGMRLAALPAAQELMSVLAERGLVQGRSSTPSHFAREVEARYPESAGLTGIVRALLRRASTNAQLTAQEHNALGELIARLRSDGEAKSGERDAINARR